MKDRTDTADAGGGETATATAPQNRKRRPHRKREILDAAVTLFAERGYHATGMNEIGAAVGITGPGIYRHFDSKEAILEYAIELAADEMLEKVQHIAESSADPRERLERLVANGIDVIIASPELIITAINERRSLSDRARSLFERAQRLRIEEWAHPLQEIRPELSPSEARFLVALTQSMLLSAIRFREEMDDDRLQGFLFNIGMAALMSEHPDA